MSIRPYGKEGTNICHQVKGAIKRRMKNLYKEVYYDEGYIREEDRFGSCEIKMCDSSSIKARVRSIMTSVGILWAMIWFLKYSIGLISLIYEGFASVSFMSLLRIRSFDYYMDPYLAVKNLIHECSLNYWLIYCRNKSYWLISFGSSKITHSATTFLPWSTIVFTKQYTSGLSASLADPSTKANYTSYSCLPFGKQKSFTTVALASVWPQVVLC